ncbi:hypothetical protein PG987_002000 [Apiospora arundinis]
MHPPYLVSLPDVEVSAAAWPYAGASISVAHILREAIRELLLGFYRIALAASPHHLVASPMMSVQLCRFDDEDEVDFGDMMKGEEIAELLRRTVVMDRLRYSHGVVAAAVGRLELINVHLNAAELDHVALAGCCTLCRFVYQDDRVGGGHVCSSPRGVRTDSITPWSGSSAPTARQQCLDHALGRFRDRSRVQPARGSSGTRDPPPLPRRFLALG